MDSDRIFVAVAQAFAMIFKLRNTFALLEYEPSEPCLPNDLDGMKLRGLRQPSI